MSEKDFSALEREIIEYLNNATKTNEQLKFKNNGSIEYVEFAGKPTVKDGEPKTDVYALLKDQEGKETELKISVKKRNADFLENKTNAIRAREILGDNWETIIEKATRSIQRKFENKYIVYFDNDGKVEAGSITLGWKFELLNKKSGELSGKIDLTKEQKVDVFSGTNLPLEKKDAHVNNHLIKNSGVADYILVADNGEIQNAQQVLEFIEPINEYVDGMDLYFACKALNYRSLYKKQNGKYGKYDGNRPLAVFIKWSVKNGKLSGELVFGEPLKHGGDYAYENLISALNELGVKNTNDLTPEKIDARYFSKKEK